jgi:hypothetical protein
MRNGNSNKTNSFSPTPRREKCTRRAVFVKILKGQLGGQSQRSFKTAGYEKERHEAAV